MNTTENTTPVAPTCERCGDAVTGRERGYCYTCGAKLSAATVEAAMVVQTFEIPSVNFPAFEAKFAKLAKRAKRLGSAPVAFELVRKFVRKVRVLNPDGSLSNPIERLYFEVRVSGPAPKFEGWALVGRMDFKAVPGSVLRMMVPGETCPAAFHDVEPGRCDHCHTNRRRNDSFIVRHDDGRELLVGRACLRDFLGHHSPQHIAAMCEWIAEVRAMAEDSERWGFGGMEFAGFDPAEVLTLSAFAVRTWGWASSKEDNSTRQAVLDLLTPSKDARTEADRLAMLAEVTDGDREKGAKALAWILEQNTDGNDYMHNLVTICGAAVTWRTMGIAVSGIVAYDRAMEREIARRNVRRGESQHVGAVKDRLDITAEVVMVRYTEGAYGTTTVVKFIDDAGNVFTWFASGGLDVAKGERYAVRGTVKKHDIYKDQRQTVLTRCKLEKLT